MKKEFISAVRKVINRIGYDAKHYHPSLHETILKDYGIKTVIDVGANTGQFAQEIHLHLPNARIYSFEPLKDCYDDLLKNMIGVEKFKAFNIALGEETGETEINRSSYSPSSSMLSMATLHKDMFPKSKDSTKENITIKRLDDVVNELLIEAPVMVKIDVQGYESIVISGGYKVLTQASVVLIETSFKTLYEKQLLFCDMYKILQSLGFSYAGNNGQRWNNETHELLFEDSIFVKR